MNLSSQNNKKLDTSGFAEQTEQINKIWMKLAKNNSDLKVNPDF